MRQRSLARSALTSSAVDFASRISNSRRSRTAFFGRGGCTTPPSARTVKSFSEMATTSPFRRVRALTPLPLGLNQQSSPAAVGGTLGSTSILSTCTSASRAATMATIFFKRPSTAECVTAVTIIFKGRSVGAADAPSQSRTSVDAAQWLFPAPGGPSVTEPRDFTTRRSASSWDMVAPVSRGIAASSSLQSRGSTSHQSFAPSRSFTKSSSPGASAQRLSSPSIGTDVKSV
mmetsp:Transcript_8041/g.27520  ORF Transcript_8041/g.27520 Transcript_8041/m.27520 type:complete len:231 (+) Transcript_8041:1101-1793(+)